MSLGYGIYNSKIHVCMDRLDVIYFIYCWLSSNNYISFYIVLMSSIVLLLVLVGWSHLSSFVPLNPYYVLLMLLIKWHSKCLILIMLAKCLLVRSLLIEILHLFVYVPIHLSIHPSAEHGWYSLYLSTFLSIFL